MSLVWVHSVGGTHESFIEAVLLSQTQERLGWTSYGFGSHWHIFVVKEFGCNSLLRQMCKMRTGE